MNAWCALIIVIASSLRGCLTTISTGTKFRLVSVRRLLALIHHPSHRVDLSRSINQSQDDARRVPATERIHIHHAHVSPRSSLARRKRPHR